MKIVTADITGSLIVNGVNVTDNVVSSSVFSGSIAGRVTNLEQFSASLDATFATDASVTASILVLSQSVQASQAALSSSYTATSASYLATSASYVIVSGSYAAASASLSIRTTDLEATASINTQASASFAAYSASVSTRLTTDETNITTLTNASASFANQSASLSTRLTTDETNITTLTNASASFAAQSASLSTRLTTDETNFNTTSGSIAGRVTLIEGQYATTGSNTFTKPQQITDVSNAIGFTSTASLYTDGGLRVKGAAYISGTAYFNDVVVYGTSSIEYITSSQLAIGTNIITLNTDTPSIRYGGISVYDSGSNNLSTGSLFWDSEKDKWIYSNPSGSTYDGGMLISGPRNTSGLGNEVGTTSCALMMGQGGDHITSSAIFSYGNATCFYGNSYVSSSGLACFTSVCSPALIGGTVSGTTGTFTGQLCTPSSLVLGTNNAYALYLRDCTGTARPVMATAGGTNLNFYNVCSTGFININNAADNATIVKVDNTGSACFASTICSPGAVFTGTARFSGGNNADVNNVAVRIDNWKSLSFYNCGDTGWAFTLGTDQLNNGLIGTNNSLNFATSPTLNTRLTITSTGIATFSCQICTVAAVTADLRYTGTGFITYDTSVSGTACLIIRQDANERLRFTSTGIACFACQVCAGAGLIANTLSISCNSGDDRAMYMSLNCSANYNSGANNTIARSVNSLKFLWYNNCWEIGATRGDDTAIQALVFARQGSTYLAMTCHGISCFACQVCAPSFIGTSATISNAGTACTVTDVLTLTTGQTGPASVCAGAGIVFTGNNGGTVARIYSRGNMNFNNGSDLVFQTQASAGGAPQCTMVINGNTQNVGIGTFNPTCKLEVDGGSSAVGLRISTTNPGTGVASLILANSSKSAFNDGMIMTHGGGYTNITTLNGATIMAWDMSTCRVGIGTTSPTTRLTVRIPAANQSIVNFTSTTGNNLFNFISNDTPGHAILDMGRCTESGTFAAGFVRLRTDGDSWIQGGNVGIGTSSPSQILHIIKDQAATTTLQIQNTNDQANAATEIRLYGNEGIAPLKNNQQISFVRGSGGADWALGQPANSSDFVIAGGTNQGDGKPDLGTAERIRITSGGNVGINTTDPKATLHVCGSTATFRVGPWFSTNDRDFIQLEAQGVETKILSPNERFKIENTDGCVQIVAGGSGGVQLTPGATSWTAISSDIRKKKNFEPTQGLAALLQIEPVKYHFQWDNDCIPKRMGFIAQNIQPLIPEMVSKTDEKAEDGSNYLTITPDYILPVLVKSIQEQQCRIKLLESCLGIM